jgi:3D (Asp-Asp-Asp) domain-containing protein
MDDARKQHRLMKVVATTAVAFGLAAGSYGIASAASNQGTTTTPTATAPTAAQPWGGRRSDETPLTGDAESKVRAVAQAAVPGGTIVRVETDADGNAKYEAHMTKSDGTPVTVYVDDSFKLVSVETR